MKYSKELHERIRNDLREFDYPSDEEMYALLDEIERLKTEHDAEVDQFNDGVAAGEKGGLDPFLDQPHYEPDYDEWRNGYYAGSYDRLTAELASKDEQIEKLEDALHKISNWCKAYPLEIADEPTEDEWKTAHAIMNQRGWSLTTFVVSGMRRVTNGIAEIADLGG